MGLLLKSLRNNGVVTLILPDGTEVHVGVRYRPGVGEFPLRLAIDAPQEVRIVNAHPDVQQRYDDAQDKATERKAVQANARQYERNAGDGRVS